MGIRANSTEPREAVLTRHGGGPPPEPGTTFTGSCAGPEGLTRKAKIHMSKTKPHTGGTAPQSGIYRPSNGAHEIAVSAGDRLPPAGGEGVDYTLVRPTKK
jgi:hypothetical protein